MKGSKVKLPFSVGDVIEHNGEKIKVRGIHLYIGRHNEISNVRAYIGNGEYVTIKKGE